MALSLVFGLLRPDAATAQSFFAASPAILQIPLSLSPTAALAEPGGREIVLIFPGALPRVDAAELERAAQPRRVTQGDGALLMLESVGRGVVRAPDPPVPVTDCRHATSDDRGRPFTAPGSRSGGMEV